MYMRDKLGSFEIIVDKERRVVHEKLSGLFTCDDSNRLDKVYKNNIVPYLGPGDWVKLVDMTEYMLNTSIKQENINKNLKNMIPYGFVACAIILSSEMLKNYISLASSDIDSIDISYFSTEQDAVDFLSSKGF